MIKSLVALMAGLTFSGAVMAAGIVEGKDYQVIEQPMKSEAPANKIEVTEVFWYGCPHCYALEKPLNEWVASLPDDVEFDRMAAPLGRVWEQHAKAFYAAKSLGIEHEMRQDFMDAIHKQGKRLTDEDDIAEFFTHYGVTKEQALKALDSFGVKSQIQQAAAKMRSYQLMGVPDLIVDNHYVVTPDSAGSLENMPKIASALIEKVREERQEAK
ncbi:thiol:disulfide interchange protein DsbA/DsbL [Salinicola endophyticus]|uniref:Thiol:disulfide interchange protein n=1 Tax=Salinicola endophyticus TaxID=1949083 RepID=A0ABY8FE86_9GAMM|nr:MULTISPECIES: thiol:disulfide interchange protein DsbA/DsbL [Salinicola]WFF40972.1 thiol:disulfide interchange protein DsbA/DsbL [Salinicola endophyticus]